MADEVEGPVLAHAVLGNDSPLCWLWVSEANAALVGVVPVAGNPRNVHAAVHWLARLRAWLAIRTPPAAFFEVLSEEEPGAFGQVQASPVRFESLAALRRASIATD